MDAAQWAIIGVVTGALMTGLFGLLLQAKQFSHEKKMFLLKNRSAEKVKEILTEMLNHRTHVRRSFHALKGAVGGYSEDELRQFLHEIGARRVAGDNSNEEWWYLETRKDEYVAKLKGANERTA